MENVNEKRVVAAQERNGLGLKEIIFVAILLAAGAVLKATVGSLVQFGGVKLNFIIAMYCLSILILKPRFRDAAIIGILGGITCQFMPGFPLINIISELVGGIVMFLMTKLPLKIGKVDLRAGVGTAFASFCSGVTYVSVLNLLYFAGVSKDKPAAVIAMLSVMALGSLLNGVLVGLIYLPVKLAFKK